MNKNYCFTKENIKAAMTPKMFQYPQLAYINIVYGEELLRYEFTSYSCHKDKKDSFLIKNCGEEFGIEFDLDVLINQIDINNVVSIREREFLDKSTFKYMWKELFIDMM